MDPFANEPEFQAAMARWRNVVGSPPPAEPGGADSASTLLQDGPERPTQHAGTAPFDRPINPPGYELLDELGHGGMGVVYRARDVALSRDVAVKLLSERYSPESVQARRFQAESQITGQLQHPGIPAVHQVGSLPDGRPFLAMKLIKGHTLEALLEERPEPTADRARFVAVFEQICHAVGYAHAHGIIHRDLKPANVMVGAFGEVQVMDWGLAKAVTIAAPPQGEEFADDDASLLTEIHSQRDADEATRTGSVLGTPAYMPPEQAIGAVDQIDVRSDVFGLGAVLCTILTGKPPYVGSNAESTRQIAARAKLDDVYTRLNDCGAEPELVALCKRCLSAEKADRPADAGTVAVAVAELRAASGERARQAEVERERSVVREAEGRKRRRLAAGLVSLVLLVLLAGIAGTTVGLIRTEWARQDAVAAQLAETKRADGEKQANELAQKRLAQIESGIEIMTSIFTDLDMDEVKAGADPLEAVLAQRLVKVARQLEGEGVGDPLVVAGLQNRLGVSLLNLGYAPDAIDLFAKARETRTTKLGADHPDTLTSIDYLASAYQATQKLDLALPLFKETLELRKAKLGADHPDTLTSMNNLARGYQADRKLALALPLFEETLKLRKAKLGADHFHSIASMNNLASGYRAAGKFDLAVPLWVKTLELNTAKRGADHPLTIASMNNLGSGYRATKKLDLALPLLMKTLELSKAKLGADHPRTLATLNLLASCYQDDRKLDLALPLFQEAAAGIEKRRFQDEHAKTIILSLIYCHEQRKQFDQAETWRRKWLAAVKERHGADSLPYASELATLGLYLLERKKWTDAESVLGECLTLRDKKQPDDWTTFNTQSMLGDALLGQKKYADAEPLLLKGYDGMKKREATIPQQGKFRLTAAVERLVQLYAAWGKPDEAAKWRKEQAAAKAK